MTLAIAIMYAIALIAAAAGLWLLVRLRGRATPQARYASGMAGTMAAALGLILAIFATAQLSWERAASAPAY
ncbi:hypothetical protein [Sphingomonas baiyangensis]|uniref:Uncharacterized protein n=1 Tax=Sphingomonas baiyangensis TaxID=2572576 RepID=A0A4U1L254_9SPHN|nr:hypothetical protein [Sphingomonas baiyangensis]TKD50055.1 hypothetical protein FBR43_04265 [Sphingomonas baiyangensis]